MNHQNGLAIAGSSEKKITGSMIDSAEFARRFSFQPYSEGSHDEATQACFDRRAVLDKRLLEEVYEQLAMQGHLSTRNLSLHANNGVVTMEGTVGDRAMRAQLGNFIRHCPFVRGVINRMHIQSPESDSDIDSRWYANEGRTRGGNAAQERAIAA
jgi:hypothetical protein